jgi:hypothetical protein
VALAKSQPPAVTRWAGQRLEEDLRVGDRFEVHRGGGAHQSRAPHNDGGQSGGERQRQARTVGVAAGSPVGQERGTRVELRELAA